MEEYLYASFRLFLSVMYVFEMAEYSVLGYDGWSNRIDIDWVSHSIHDVAEAKMGLKRRVKKSTYTCAWDWYNNITGSAQTKELKFFIPQTPKSCATNTISAIQTDW